MNPDDVECVGTLAAFGVTLAVSGPGDLVLVPVAVEVTNTLAEKCTGTVLTATGVLPP